MCQPGHFKASEQWVRSNLSKFPDIHYHPGWIPSTFYDLPERNYRFVHVDVDLYEPTYACLEYFYPRLHEGGIIISDDFNWTGARQAIKEFSEKYAISYTVTGHGQAYFIKNKLN
jgi:hypothetical protein